jgi:predicted DNA-binding transcriptional regulator AlpA
MTEIHVHRTHGHLPQPEPIPDVFEQLLQSSRLLTGQELSRILRLSPKTLYSYAERDLIPHFKIETSIRYSGMEVAEWLRSRKHCAHQHFQSLPARRMAENDVGSRRSKTCAR